MATKEAKFYKNGDPMLQVVVRVQTEERDPTIPNDDGIRAVYVKGKTIKVVREAVKAGGGSKIEVGGFLSLTYVNDDPPTGGLPQGAKLFSCEYHAPKPGDTPEPDPWANQPDRSPPQAAPPTPANAVIAGMSEDQKAALRALGVQV
jgi:hypothetical protein